MQKGDASARLGPLLEKALRQSLGDPKAPLHEMARYHFGWPVPAAPGQGRAEASGPAPREAAMAAQAMVEFAVPRERLHGMLCLLVVEHLTPRLPSLSETRRTGEHEDAALAPAVAIELLAAARDIHEDLRLGHPQRGPRPAVWWAFGHAQAINAGDGLYAQARLAVMEGKWRNAEARRRGGETEAVLGLLAVLDRCWLAIATAAHEEIEADAGENQTLKGRLAAIEGTDGGLMEAAAELGALAAGAGKHQVGSIAQAGRLLGIAWRLRQEMEALWQGTPEALLEVLDKRRSVPLLYALEHGTAKQLRNLNAAALREQPLDDARVAQVRRALEEAGGKAQSEALAELYLGKALEALNGLEGGRGALEGFARRLAAAG